MTFMVRTIASALVIGGIAQTAGAQSADARKDIAAVNETFMTAFQKADAAGVAALYTAQAEALPPGSDIVRGRDAIQKMWQSAMDSGVASATLTTRDLEPLGDVAWESGSYELRGKDGASLDRGKYIVIWTREQGQWRLHRDIWNTSMPAKP